MRHLTQFFGGQKRLAKALGVSQGAVSNWVRGANNMDAHHALKIEKLTDGKFKAVDLCPRLAELEQITTQQKTPSDN